MLLISQSVVVSHQVQLLLVVLVLLPLVVVDVTALQTVVAVPRPPAISPATGLPNRFYTWREGQSIRYQVSGEPGAEPVVLVHGLFVNSDHWRKTLTQLNDGGEKKYRIYALDLFGCGYSDKPPSQSELAQRCNGEIPRFYNNDDASPTILRDVPLGSPDGVMIRVRDVELPHPLKSPYNFYTWSDLITDFCRDVVLGQNDDDDDDSKQGQRHKDVALVCNSIGSISSFQAVIDTPQLYKGVFVVSPNFRELHSAEVAFPSLTMPVLRKLQAFLRTFGKTLYDALATPSNVRKILKVPYAVREAVDDVLVQVLLDPLLTTGAMEVVFETLSYSAGPLPEQQLQMFPANKPVWICYGKADPWTPGKRVEAMATMRVRNPPVVERAQGWEGVGHCPHDEAPELVHPMLLEFLERVSAATE